jgi:putative ubiquitin-RnfH superfamily antitoxin RatB of RatAB toxin-antitoxin module
MLSSRERVPFTVRGERAMRVWVVYALPDRQSVQELELPESTTVAEAVARSGLLQKFPEIAERPLACAIYGRAVTDSQTLRADDRVEILRPLQVDPKESRRRAAARGRTPRK